MKDLKFIEGNPPTGFKKISESFLFNTDEHRAVQSSGNWYSFHLLDEAKKKIPASIHFHVDGSSAQSPLQAPFGSFEFSLELPVENLYKFLEQTEHNLFEKGVRKISIIHPPQAYQPIHTSVAQVLFINSGYDIVKAEINTSIDVTMADFEDHIDPWELRKLKQGRKAQLQFEELPINQIEKVYQFILSCRDERQQSLSMSFSNLQKTFTACPKSFVLFEVTQNGEVIAASIAVRVSKRILYNFYSAHPRKMDSVSPAVALTEGLYKWCKKNDIPLLDLGTSALDNFPNFNLLEFKIRLGGMPSARNTYQKTLR